MKVHEAGIADIVETYQTCTSSHPRILLFSNSSVLTDMRKVRQWLELISWLMSLKGIDLCLVISANVIWLVVPLLMELLPVLLPLLFSLFLPLHELLLLFLYPLNYALLRPALQLLLSCFFYAHQFAIGC